jgi:cellulose synthase/poly-beta-1,6-N-acetylglucosamine synthase-like glycosyltransferase
MQTVTIIIPVKPDGKVAALEALKKLKYPAEWFEILVAEGTCPSRQRNLAAREAQGDLLYFLDDDSRPFPDALHRCVAAFRDEAVAVVGGPSLTPAGDTLPQRLFGVALSSLFGAGAMRNRYRATGSLRRTTEKELILCNLAFRRELFLRADGFDERLYPNEENELLDRIAASGNTLLHDPAIAVERSQRPTLAAFMRQMFGYGRGRAQQTLLAGPGSLVSFAPLLFVCYLLFLPLLSAAPLWNVPLLAYTALVVIFSLVAAVGSGRLESLLLLLLFPLMHCCNGTGLLWGFAGGKPMRGRDGQVAVRRVKAFDQDDW